MPKAADFSAIYGIRHIASGRIYVGSAVRTNAQAYDVAKAGIDAVRQWANKPTTNAEVTGGPLAARPVD